MIPTPRLAWLAALAVPLALVGLFGTVGLWPFAVYDLLLLLAVAGDLLLTPGVAYLAIEREAPDRGVQGKPLRVRLVLSWRGPRGVFCRVRELPPAGMALRSPRFTVRVPARSRRCVEYEAVAGKRGALTFGAITARLSGPLGLIERQRAFDAGHTVRVYPDLVTLSSREASLIVGSPHKRGVRRAAFKGEGREFHQLRAYAPGDDPRQVDWKAYARHGRPLVREFRAESNQRLLLLIDAGRLMTSQVGDRLRFDWAVQAAGRLARVALEMGDRVGLGVFSRDLRRFVAASRGPGHLNRLADVLCDCEPDLDEPDLDGVLRRTLRSGARRTLVVLFSEVADPRAAGAAVRCLGRLAPRHLGVLVTLADADLDAERHIEVGDVACAYRRLAADEMWLEYRQTVSALEARGASVVRARADALAAETVERYAEIKRQGRL